MKEIKLKKCAKCGATVEVFEDCKCESNCGIRCCNEPMQEIKPNSVECSVEKHLPKIEVVGKYIVASVDHVMEAEHYIEWIALEAEGVSGRKYFKAGETAKAIFPYVSGSKVYAYCNKHGLWCCEVQ